jgi:carbonic anhydrase/acetyltransferase-like protein (isoleucine patch superfamily)
MSERIHISFEDPISLVPRIINKLHSLWLVWTYPFLSVGDRFWAHYSCDLQRPMASYMRIGNSVLLQRDVWLNIPFFPDEAKVVIWIEDGSNIGRRCMISAQNQVHIGQNVVFGPQVLVTDHNHEFENVSLPIAVQGTTGGGTIRIEEGCWIGFGAAILCSHGELVIGKNSVVGANSVVTRSVPPYSVVTGNPARVVKQFDSSKGQWVLGSVKPTTLHGAK